MFWAPLSNLSDQVWVIQPVPNVHFATKIFFWPGGARGKLGHVFEPIGFNPGRPLSAPGGEMGFQPQKGWKRAQN